MANGWTPERRARQATLIHNWQPWRQSTGPKTQEGKAVSSRNADKPESMKRQLRLLKAMLRHIQRRQKEIERQFGRDCWILPPEVLKRLKSES